MSLFFYKSIWQVHISFLIVALHVISKLLTNILASSEQHHSVLLEEKRVVNISVSSSHRALVHHHSLGFPHLQNGHAGNGTVRVFKG